MRTTWGIAAAAAMMLLSACDATVYESRTGDLKTAFSGLSDARSAFAARPAGLEVDEASALLSGDAIRFDGSCVQRAGAAQDKAAKLAGAGEPLDAVYADGGPLSTDGDCYVGLTPRPKPKAKPKPAADAPAAPAPAPAETKPGKPPKPPMTVEEVIAADEQTCQARLALTPPPAPKPADVAQGAGGEDSPNEQLWAALQAYVDDLAKISAAAETKRLTDASGGAGDKLKALSDKAGGGPIGVGIQFLFQVIDKAVEQQRYEDLKTSVVCGNAMLLKWRGPLKDALRYQQIAAYDVRARSLDADVSYLQALYDDPANCAKLAASGSMADLAAGRCDVLIARRGLLAKTPDDHLRAATYLQVRSGALAGKLAELKSSTAAVNALGAADPGPAVDAFIKAHRALRDDIVAGKGQAKALFTSFQDLYSAGDALNKALKPAKKDADTKAAGAGS
jgi:hypothetical protein